jgi:hypothetical protein
VSNRHALAVSHLEANPCGVGRGVENFRIPFRAARPPRSCAKVHYFPRGFVHSTGAGIFGVEWGVVYWLSSAPGMQDGWRRGRATLGCRSFEEPGFGARSGWLVCLCVRARHWGSDRAQASPFNAP